MLTANDFKGEMIQILMNLNRLSQKRPQNVDENLRLLGESVHEGVQNLLVESWTYEFPMLLPDV